MSVPAFTSTTEGRTSKIARTLLAGAMAAGVSACDGPADLAEPSNAAMATARDLDFVFPHEAVNAGRDEATGSEIGDRGIVTLYPLDDCERQIDPEPGCETGGGGEASREEYLEYIGAHILDTNTGNQLGSRWGNAFSDVEFIGTHATSKIELRLYYLGDFVEAPTETEQFEQTVWDYWDDLTGACGTVLYEDGSGNWWPGVPIPTRWRSTSRWAEAVAIGRRPNRNTGSKLGTP